MAAGLALGVALVMPGCGGSGERRSDPAVASTRAPASESGSAQAPPVVRASAVRERALAMVEEFARDGDAQLRANAVEAAGVMPQRTGALIRAAWRDPHQAVRTVGLMVAGQRGIREVEGAARAGLEDPSPYVRAAAIFALAKTGRSVDRSPLATMLLEDANPRVRAHAAVILGELGDESAKPLLRSAAARSLASASSGQARLLDLQIAEALVKLGEEEQRNTIVAALFPSMPEELEGAALAAQIIGLTGDRRATGQLRNVVAHRDRAGQPYPAEIRLAAAGSLASLGSGGWGTPVETVAMEFVGHPNPALRAQAAFVLGQMAQGPSAGRSLAELDRLMGDPEAGVRLAAASAVLKAWAGTR